MSRSPKKTKKKRKASSQLQLVLEGAVTIREVDSRGKDCGPSCEIPPMTVLHILEKAIIDGLRLSLATPNSEQKPKISAFR